MSATTTNTYSNKDILKISFPVLMSLLMEHLIGLTDTAYLGRVGEVELGACALAGVYYLVIYMLGFGFSVGAQVMMARRHGSGEHRRMGRCSIRACSSCWALRPSCLCFLIFIRLLCSPGS